MQLSYNLDGEILAITNSYTSIPRQEMKLKINIVVITFHLVVLLGVFNAVFRFYLLDSPFFFLVYVPQLLMIFVVSLHVISFLVEREIKRRTVLLITLLLLALFTGIIYTQTLLQVVMGVYILIPIFFGYIVYPKFERILRFKKYYSVLLLFGIAGVIINVNYILPWEGFSYVVNGQEIQGNRFWTSSGTRRLSGFGRSSFETAAYILFLALMVLSKRFKIKFLWLLSGIAIYYTNTKGIFLAYLVISLFVMLWSYMPYILKKGFLFFVIAANIILPLASWIFSIHRLSNIKMLRSFEDRLNRSWPDAYLLITESGSFITGRGLGGIGVPQNIYEPEKALPGDNLFVYLAALFGVGAFLLYIYLMFSILKKTKKHAHAHTMFYILSLYIFIYGVTTNIVELPVMAICLGLVFRYWTEKIPRWI